MVEIKIHAEWSKPNDHYASVTEFSVFSILIGGQRLFFRRRYDYDRRGSHYGEVDEHLRLLRDPIKRQHYRRRFVRRGQISESVFRALKESVSKNIIIVSSMDSEGEHGDFYREYQY